MRAFKITCYAALAAITAAAAALFLVHPYCSRLDEGAITCAAPWATSVASAALMVILLAAFTAIPAPLALGGVVFLVLDAVQLFFRSKAGPGDTK